MSDERPKKSWREIDQQRDGSGHRREARPDPFSRDRGPRSQKSYRAKLDQAFNSGKIGQLIAQAEPATSAPSPPSDETRLKLLRGIRDADGRDRITQAIDAFVARYDIPDDFEVLTQMLAHRRPAQQEAAMVQLDRLLAEQRPKRAAVLIGQLKLVRDTSDDPEMADLAAKLLAQL